MTTDSRPGALEGPEMTSQVTGSSEVVAELRQRIREAFNRAHNPNPPGFEDLDETSRHDGHIFSGGCYVCRGDVAKLVDAALSALAPVLAEKDREIARLQRDMDIRDEGADTRIVQLEQDLDRAESSRRDWAAEAMDHDMAAEHQMVGTLDDPWPQDPAPDAPCACPTPDQLSKLDPAFTPPQCAVHPRVPGAGNPGDLRIADSPPFRHADGTPCYGCQTCLADDPPPSDPSVLPSPSRVEP